MDKSYAQAISERHENHFFDASAMRCFNSRVLDSTWTKMDDDTYRFITSERFDAESPRLYTIREFTVSTGSTETVGEFQAYRNSRTALAHIRD